MSNKKDNRNKHTKKQKEFDSKRKFKKDRNFDRDTKCYFNSKIEVKEDIENNGYVVLTDKRFQYNNVNIIPFELVKKRDRNIQERKSLMKIANKYNIIDVFTKYFGFKLPKCVNCESSLVNENHLQIGACCYLYNDGYNLDLVEIPKKFQQKKLIFRNRENITSNCLYCNCLENNQNQIIIICDGCKVENVNGFLIGRPNYRYIYI
jgi:hypothetical protein